MPNQPRASNGNRTIRVEDDLWEAFAKACTDLGVGRNQRLIQHMQADVDHQENR